MISHTQKSFWLMATAALVGAWIAVATKILSAELSTAVIFFMTRLFLLIFAVPTLCRYGTDILKVQRPWLMALMCLFYVSAFLCYFQAIAMAPLSFASLFFNSAPLYVPLFAYFVIADQSIKSKGFWLGLGISFIGVALILIPTGHVAYSFLGLGLAFTAGVLMAMSQVAAKVLMRSEPPERVVFMQVIFSLVISAIPALFIIVPHSHYYLSRIFEPRTVLILLSASCCSWFYQTFRARAVKLASSVAVIMPFGYLGVVFVGIADALIWHVIPDVVGMIGIVLVIGGVVLLLNLRR